MPGLELREAPGNDVRIGLLRRCSAARIAVTGRGNVVEVADGASLTNVTIQIESDGNRVVIGRDVKFCGRIVQKLTDGNAVIIGDGTTMGRAVIICGEGRSITIGRDCMIAFDVDLRTTDSHVIEDAATGERINPGADIVIGDHVWIAARATILKGVRIADGCVVGIGAVVTRDCAEPNAVLGGNPARVLRRGVRWHRPIIG